MQHAKETAPEATAERCTSLELNGHTGIIQSQLVKSFLEFFIVIWVLRVYASEHHGFRLSVPRKGFDLIAFLKECVTDVSITDCLHIAKEVANLACL